MVLTPNTAFLCLRRGVSDFEAVAPSFTRLFSAYAEVFPPLPAVMGNFLSFLCLRRGVSPLTTSAETLDDFSLPTQRCFHFADPENWGKILFSAYAEVFPFVSTSQAKA